MHHPLESKHECNELNTLLEIVMGDIALNTMIREFTDYETRLLQMRKFAACRCTISGSKEKLQPVQR